MTTAQTSIGTKTIEEVIEKLIDYRGKTPTKTTHGVVLITAKVIKDGRIVNKKHEYIADNDYDSWMRRGLPKKGDVLITTEAPLGEVAQLKTDEKIALAQRVILLRANPEVMSQQYLFYVLQSPFVQAGLRARGTGTTVLGIKQSELRQIDLPYHPFENQKKIASVLTALDDLIENNNKRMKILEEMARMAYREWFVHYRFCEREKIKMVDSGTELGAVPQGWKVSSIGDLLESSLGGAWGNETFEEDTKETSIIRGTDFVDLQQGTELRVPQLFVEERKRQKRLLKYGDLVIENSINAKTRSAGSSLLITREILNLTGQETICASFCKRFRFKNPKIAPLIHLHMQYLHESGQIEKYQVVATNGIANFQAERFIESNHLALPTDKSSMDFMLQTFDSLTSSIFAAQIYKLRIVRDFLLPKLISGQIIVA